MVQYVLKVHADCQVVPLSTLGSTETASAGTASAPTATTTASAASAAAADAAKTPTWSTASAALAARATTSVVLCRRFSFAAESKGLTDSQICDQRPGCSTVVSGNNCFAYHRIWIERAEPREHDSRFG